MVVKINMDSFNNLFITKKHNDRYISYFLNYDGKVICFVSTDESLELEKNEKK